MSVCCLLQCLWINDALLHILALFSFVFIFGFGKTIGISLKPLQNVVLSSPETVCLEVQDTSKINYSRTYLIQKLLYIKDDYFSIWDAYFLIIRDFISTYIVL